MLGEDHTVVAKGQEGTTDFDFREDTKNPYNYRQVMSRHLIELLLKHPDFSYSEIAHHCLFQDVITLVAAEDRVRSYSTNHQGTDSDFNVNQPVFDTPRWTDKIKDGSVLVHIRTPKAQHNLDEVHYVGLQIERRNMRVHPPKCAQLRKIIGTLWTENFEYWESIFPRFSMWLFMQAPLVGDRPLCADPEFNEYYPATYNFYNACANICIKKQIKE